MKDDGVDSQGHGRHERRTALALHRRQLPVPLKVFVEFLRQQLH